MYCRAPLGGQTNCCAIRQPEALRAANRKTSINVPIREKSKATRCGRGIGNYIVSVRRNSLSVGKRCFRSVIRNSERVRHSGRRSSTAPGDGTPIAFRNGNWRVQKVPRARMVGQGANLSESRVVRDRQPRHGPKVRSSVESSEACLDS
jgi:hypothetical protein